MHHVYQNILFLSQVVGTPALGMGAVIMGPGTPTIMGTVGTTVNMLSMGNIPIRDGNQLQVMSSCGQIQGVAQSNFPNSLDPCPLFPGSPALLAAPSLAENGAGLHMPSMLMGPGVVPSLGDLGSNMHIGDNTGRGGLMPEVETVFGNPSGQFWAGV